MNEFRPYKGDRVRRLTATALRCRAGRSPSSATERQSCDDTNMLATNITAAITAVVTGLVTFAIQERRLKTEMRTEFMAEQAAKSLLEDEKWKKRSFSEFKKRLGGFDDNELRKILLRSGAVKFESTNGDELWGLIFRNKDDL